MTQTKIDIQDKDVFLLGVKRTLTGDQNERYANKTIPYEELADNIRKLLAIQELSGNPGVPGVPGMMFPDETLTYDKDGRLGVNIDSRGVVLKQLMNESKDLNNDGTGYSDPLFPPFDSKVGDFYIVNASGIKLNTSWNIE